MCKFKPAIFYQVWEITDMKTEGFVKRILVVALMCLFVLCEILTIYIVGIPDTVSAQTYATNDAMTAVKAELAEQHGSHDGWTAISSSGKISKSGSYYLTKDITGSLEFAHPGNYTLCLNGYMINANGSGSAIWFSDTYLDGGTNFTVIDCNGSHTTHNYNIGSDGKYNFTSSGTAGSVEGGVITGGNARDGGGISAYSDTSVTINGVTVAGNKATNAGGGIYTYYSSSSLQVKNSVIEGNVATNGGGIFSETYNFIIENTIISNNKASSAGGGLYSNEQYNDDYRRFSNILNSKFLNNTAANGGGVALGNTQGFSPTNAGSEFTGVEFSYNTASGIGGGIYCVSKSKIQFSGIEFSYNTAKSGGAVYSGGNNVLTFSSGDIFSTNTATASVSATTYEALEGGGAIYASGGSITLPSGVTIHNNKADSAYGGGILATGSASISMSTSVSGNSAKHGGGTYVRFSTSTQGSLSISGAISVYDNTGGNLYLYSGSSNYINISGTLNNDSRIGVTLESGKGVFATGYDKVAQVNAMANKYFFSDEGFEIFEENGNLRFQEHYVDGNEYANLPSSSDLNQGTIGSPVYYYLTSDTSRSLNVSGHVVLDLNGYKLSGSVTIGGSLGVIDSSSERSGEIDAGSGTAVNVQGGEFTLKGGTLSGDKAISVSGGSAIIEDGYIGSAMTGNITLKGGLFAQGDVDGNTVFGISLTSGYNVKAVSSTIDDPRYKDGYPYAVYFGEDEHSSYGTMLSGAATLTDGFYYLTQDITLSSDQFIFVTGNVTICLHGHTIYKSRPNDGFPDPNWEMSADSVAIKVISGGNLIIDDCDGGGYLPNGVDYDYTNSSLTIRGGHIGGNYMLSNSFFYATIEGGYFTSMKQSGSDENYVWMLSDKTDPDYDLQYPFAVYKRGYTSLSITTNSRPYNGQSLSLGNEFYATAYAGYGEPKVNWSYYLDSGHSQFVNLKDMVNAGTYYIEATIPAYLEIKGREKIYYSSQTKYGNITIEQLESEINVKIDLSVPLFTTSEFPTIFTSEGDTPGSVTWDEGQTLQAGTEEYSWTFVPDDPNYKTVSGTVELKVEPVRPNSIKITQAPIKTEYTALEIFDPRGMTVLAYFNDGSVIDVTDAVRIGNGTEITLTYGENGIVIITVYYRGGDMTEVTTEIEVYVNKIFVSAPEAATGLVYDGTEKVGVADGDLYCVTKGSAINAGDYTAELKLKDNENYKWEDGFDGMLEWSIAQAPSVGYTVPSDIKAAYGQTLSEITLPVGWKWKDENIVINKIGNNIFAAIYTTDDSGNYAPHEEQIIVSVSKAVPEYVVPEGLTAVYGSMLADVNLPIGWSWQNNSQLVGAVGEKSFVAVFTPEDTVNYETVTKSLKITVEKATPVYTVPENLTAVYGNALSDVKLPAGWSWQNADQSVGNAGQHSFDAVFTPADTTNYVSVTKSLTVTVEKATPQYEVPTGITIEKGQSLSDIELPEGWTWKEGATVAGSSGEVTYTVVYTPSDTENYEIIEIEITVNVESASLSGGEIAGITVGSLAGLSGIGTLVWFLIRRKKRIV